MHPAVVSVLTLGVMQVAEHEAAQLVLNDLSVVVRSVLCHKTVDHNKPSRPEDKKDKERVSGRENYRGIAK